MTPQRILIAAGIFPPDSGGPASYVPRIARALAARGHTVNVVCLSDRTDHDDRAWGFGVTRIRRGGFKPLRGARTVFALSRHGRSADVLYANGLGGEAMLASILTRIPAVHKIVGDHAWERARNHRWFEGTIDEYQGAAKGWWLRLLDLLRTAPLRQARRVVVPSTYLGRLVYRWGIPADRVTVIYNAVDGAPCPPRLRSGGMVATVCRLVPWKGVDGILRALSGLPEASLVIVGDGPSRDDLVAVAASCAVEDRVRFLGEVPTGEVAACLAAADLFVLNSTYEGLPHVVLEAMLAGVPVVATAVGGTPEVVTHEETGLLVPASDDQALASAMRRLLADPDLGARLARAAQRTLEERFSSAVMVQETEALLLHATGEQ